MKSKVPLTEADIMINHGANMGLLGALLAFTNEGDEILVPEIGYPFFKDVCPAMKRVAKTYKLKHDNNFEVDLEHVKSLVTDKTQFLFVINPSNPMGTIFSKSHMEDIIRVCDECELPLLSDEIYYGQSFPSETFISFAEVTEDVPVVIISG